MNIEEEHKRCIDNLIGYKVQCSDEELIEIFTELIEANENKKRTDLTKKYLDELKFILGNNEEIYKQSKDKIFYSYLKIDNKTRYYNTVLNDKLTPTMAAYYFCDKQRQILSDKEAAAVKAMSLENEFEMMDDDLPVKLGRIPKDCEEDSNHSNTNSNAQFSLYNSSFIEKGETPRLKKKRKNSCKNNNNGKGNYKKVPRGTNKTPYDESEDCPKYTYNSNGDDDLRDEEEENQEYCLTTCLLDRKYQHGQEMIRCDGCFIWYHPQCIKMSNEEYKFNSDKDVWHCFECKNEYNS